MSRSYTRSVKVSMLALAPQRGNHDGVVEAVLVDHGAHALNAEVSLQDVQRVCGTSGLLLATRRRRSSPDLLAEVQPLQLSLQLAGQRAESGPPPCRVGRHMAGQRRLRAGFPEQEAAVGSAALPLLPPPPGGALLRRGRPGGRSLSEDGAQSSQHAGLRLHITEPQTSNQSELKLSVT